MVRPRKRPEERLHYPIPIRFTNAQRKELQQRALAAGVTVTHYVRETALGRRPKARSVNRQVLDKVLYELQSIATNLAQLEKTTGDESFGPWARYVGGELVERIIGRPELLPALENSLDELNAAGQFINQLAHRVNSGKPLVEQDTGDALEAIREATAPIHEAIKRSSIDSDFG